MKFLVTAGPTREYLDDVRYLSNASTGRMGYWLAEAAGQAGHEVTLVHGPMPHAPPPVARAVAVTSALEMLAAVAAEFDACDVFIACAAVSDYRPRARLAGKLKREASETLTLDLVQNPDIVREMSARRRRGGEGRGAAGGPGGAIDRPQIVIGFALESRDPEENARGKLRRKGLDAILLNAPSVIGSDETEITIFRSDNAGETAAPPLKFRGPKSEAARRIVALAESLAAAK